jgi:hypothetical protein
MRREAIKNVCRTRGKASLEDITTTNLLEGRYTAGYAPAIGKCIIKNVLGKTLAEVKEKLAMAMDDTKDSEPVFTKG